MKNPYSSIIQHMREQGGKFNTPYVQIGVVTASDPLVIQLGDLKIGKENLLIADYLLPNYGRKMTVPEITATGSTTGGSITSIGIPDGDISFTDGLNIGDVLALTPSLELEGQKYIVLARLVSP